jgi:DNA-binding MarR family transcriptional regulator
MDPLLDRQLCFAIYSAQRAMVRAYGPLLDPLGLTYPQYLVLLALADLGTATVGELGERLHLDSGTLSPLLKRMEAIGSVERRRDAQDERRVEVRLTQRGERLREKARDIPLKMLACSGLKVHDATRMRDELTTLYRTLTQEQ